MGKDMFKTTKLTAAVLALALAGPLAAQDGTPKAGGTLNVVIQPEPPSLMIGLVQNGPTQMVGGDIYESLLPMIDLKPEGQLAESWKFQRTARPIPSGAQGVVFHDGEPFTSADVEFSMDKFLRETHSRMRTIWSTSESIDTPDDYTVVFKLKQPFGPFIGIFEAGTAPMIPSISMKERILPITRQTTRRLAPVF